MRRVINFSFAFLFLIFSAGAQKDGGKKERCKPFASVSGYKGAAIIKAKAVSSLKTLEAINECKDGRSYTVMSFDLNVILNKKTKLKFTGTYGDISAEMKKSLARCKAGSTVVFSNVRVKSGDGKFETLQGVTLHVK